ncbi:MAG: LPS export ABC transporter periplasmic protein LptC [Dissulfurispiraceae bacterium]|jgi:LPS export ABC transporter protein LptC|nr:LPS export ABC transporter periplasmic protein LptC [Dissulfurispiraceae bacterium]
MKKVLFFAVSVFLVSMLTFYFNYEKDMKAGIKMSEFSYMDEVNIMQRKAGVRKWTLKSDRATFINDNDVRLHKVTIDFPERGLVLTSDSGLYNMATKNISVEGNIKAAAKDYDIIANKLQWDAERQEITSDKRVNIVGKRFNVVGDKLEAAGDKARLINNIKAIFYGK